MYFLIQIKRVVLQSGKWYLHIVALDLQVDVLKFFPEKVHGTLV